MLNIVDNFFSLKRLKVMQVLRLYAFHRDCTSMYICSKIIFKIIGIPEDTGRGPL